MAADASLSDVLSTSTMTGLFVAGLSLGAVYALSFTLLGRTPGGGAGAPGAEEGQTHAGATSQRVRGPLEDEKSGEDITRSTTGRKRRRKGKGMDVGDGDGDVGDGEDEGKGEAEGQAKRGTTSGATATVPFPRVIPGDFEGVGADVDAQEAAPAELTSKPSSNIKTQQKKKTKKQKQKEKQETGQGGPGESKEVGLETAKVADVGRTAPHAHNPRSDESTDASVSLSVSMSGDVPRGSRGMASTRRPLLAPSLSFDTDSSWTQVDPRLMASALMDGQARKSMDAMGATSSDQGSTASESPVAERMDNVTLGMRGARVDLAQRTLAGRFVPRPRKTGIDDTLEQPDVPSLARIMRVQPPVDESPVPGFSWDDYGDVVEDSVLVHDADEEDEGEWGVVKSRHRTRPTQSSSTTASTSTSHVPAAPETMTKKQRQNARRREATKAAKAEAEEARLQGLAKHKRELDRLRIIEESRQGGGKRPSGGMQAAVDEQGKLVWE